MGFAWKDVDPAFCLCCHARRIIWWMMDLEEGLQAAGCQNYYQRITLILVFSVVATEIIFGAKQLKARAKA